MPDPESRISALIIARDEAETLPACLDSLRWADEIVVVVDAASRDATEAIARARADRVAVRVFDDFASQRNAALDLATGDWVLAIDADERVVPELAQALRAIANDPAPVHSGYRVPIRSVILGRRFTHSGTQGDRPLRFFRRGAGRWVGLVHETVALRGTTGRLTAWLDHRTIPDLGVFLRKIDRYTTLESRKLHAQGALPRRFDLTVRPLALFLKLYLGKQGFRDGAEGFLFCALSAVSALVRQWKLRVLVRDQLQFGSSREAVGTPWMVREVSVVPRVVGGGS